MTEQTQSQQLIKPPANTLRVKAWRDMSNKTSWQAYLVTPSNGEPHTIRVRKNNRIVLDAAIKQPILAASPVRISDNIHILKRDYGVNFETRMYENDTATDRAKYGVYFLIDKVEKIENSEVAA